ncbi:hypothetical protein DL98DRAFT_623734 [Cadophora sp. DSE1049]|nr:hypothetical protein DL98DRAFT_623734 [Cadophora sp. DSE1049]
MDQSEPTTDPAKDIHRHILEGSKENLKYGENDSPACEIRLGSLKSEFWDHKTKSLKRRYRSGSGYGEGIIADDFHILRTCRQFSVDVSWNGCFVSSLKTGLHHFPTFLLDSEAHGLKTFELRLKWNAPCQWGEEYEDLYGNCEIWRGSQGQTPTQIRLYLQNMITAPVYGT